jgi:raffinose/stachyose/melibiose transport system substrate-binding protein
MFRKRLPAVSAVAALALVAACGSSGPGGSSGAASAWALTGGDEQTFRSSFESWNKANPNATISPTFFANDAYKQKVRAALGADEGPTLLFSWGGGTLKSWVDANKVMDLSEAVASDPELAGRFLPAVAKTGMIADKTYALPNNAMQPVVLYYNKELFSRVGAEPPKTWDDLMALVPRFKEAGIAPLSMGGQSKWPMLMWLEYLVDRVGGPEVFADIAANKPDAWSNPAVTRANTMIRELVDAGGFINGFASIATDSNADAALLYTGKAAMYLMGSWAYPTIKTANAGFVADGKLGYAPFPAVQDGKGDPADIVGNPANFWSVSATAPESAKKAALDYLKKGVMSPEYVDALLAGGAVPPVQGIEAKIGALPDAAYLSTIYELAGKAPSFQLSWDQALDPGQADALLTNLSQVFLKQITPQEFSDAMNKTITS